MKIKDTEEYIMINREIGDSESSFLDAFDTGIVTLMVGKDSKKVNGIKVWKVKKVV